MYSNKFEYDRRWQYGDRNSRDDGNARWKERPGAHGDAQRGVYHKYGGEAHTSAERTSGSKEYSDSPQRPYYKEQPNRERSRKSPVRRRPSSPEWSVSEKRRRRYTEEEEAEAFRYRYESEDKMYKYSPDDSQRTHASKDFKRATPPEEDFKYRKTPQEPRPRQQHEDFTYRHEAEEFAYRRPSYKDRDGRERSRDHSAERTRPQEFPAKTSAKAREKHYSPTEREEHQPRTRFPLNGSRGEVYERDVGNPAPAAPDQKTKGFQRFLDVLNKGVDISALKKFAKPASSGEDHRPPSPASHSGAADQPGAPTWPRKQRTPDNSCTWSQSKGSRGGDSAPQQSHRSFSPKRRSPSHEAGGSHFSSNSRSRSPTEVEKRTMTPEEEHKHRQMQDVLHAIGMDLGFEELGQMSSRIQERLYGKKDGDRSRRHKEHRENARPAFSPQRRSRSSTSSSSSSRSNYSPLTRGNSPKNDSHKGERDITKEKEAADKDYTPQMTSSVLLDTGRSENNSQESSVSSPVCSLMPTFPTYSTSTQPPVPLMTTYPPVHYSPYSLYPPPTLPSAVPPAWAPVGPRPLLPTSFFPFPHAPQLNIHPALIAQVTHAFPQPVPNYPPPLLNIQDASKQKAKTQSRPRCLQVIDTQQTG